MYTDMFYIKIKKIFKNRFFLASFWMYFGTLILNTGNYLYHLLTARMLGRGLYGELESLIALVYILSIPWTTLTLVVVKFVSSYKGKGETSSISRLYYYLWKKLIFYGFLFGIVLLLLSPFIISFLHISSFLSVLFLIGVFLMGILTMLNRSFLQGVSDFFSLAMSNSVEAVSKLSFAVVLIFLGYKVLGAFAAIAIGILFGFFVAYYSILKLRFSDKGSIKVQQLFRYTLPAFLTTFGMTSLFTTDVLLVRHFFSSGESGSYAALSVLGKIIFFAASPITFVMFPFVSEHHARGEKYSHFLFISLGISVLVGMAISVLYFMIPDFITRALFGNQFISIIPYLGLFGLFISTYTICYLLSSFYLSIHKTKTSYLIIMAAILQIILITFMHSTLLQVIMINTGVVFLLLVFLLLYYLRL